MPILPAEPDVFPGELFADEPSALSGPRDWWVLHTRPRQEKSLARRLHAQGVPFYLPTVARRGRVRGRVLTARVPLFPGYLFLWGDAADRQSALATNRVVRALAVAEQPRLWDDLRQIHRLLAAGRPVTPEDRLVPGAPVEIAHGPLVGLRGTISRTASGRRFVVQVDFIQRGASVMLDDFALVPLQLEGSRQKAEGIWS
jgi:transcription antitermination factor NusG